MRFKDYLKEDVNKGYTLEINFQTTNNSYDVWVDKIVHKLLVHKYPTLENIVMDREYIVVTIPNISKEILNSSSKINQVVKDFKETFELNDVKIHKDKNQICLNIEGGITSPIDTKDLFLVKLTLQKNDKLTNIHKHISSLNILTIDFKPDWIGGVLDLFELKSKTNFFNLYCFDSKPGSGLFRVVDFLKENLGSLDKWDAQEELEKDKATKPFASE
jgi:hypothetical protein